MPGIQREAHWRLSIAGSQNAVHTGTDFIQDCGLGVIVLMSEMMTARRT